VEGAAKGALETKERSGKHPDSMAGRDLEQNSRAWKARKKDGKGEETQGGKRLSGLSKKEIKGVSWGGREPREGKVCLGRGMKPSKKGGGE